MIVRVASLPAHGRMALAALAILLVLGDGVSGKPARRCHGLYGIVRVCDAGATVMPRPDSVFKTTLGGTKYLCARWGSPPKRLRLDCVPLKALKPGAA
jgi:hypothetical protein